MLETRNVVETGLRWYPEDVSYCQESQEAGKRILTDGSVGVGSSIVLRAWENHVQGEGLDGST